MYISINNVINQIYLYYNLSSKHCGNFTTEEVYHTVQAETKNQGHQYTPKPCDIESIRLK